MIIALNSGSDRQSEQETNAFMAVSHMMLAVLAGCDMVMLVTLFAKTEKTVSSVKICG